jgi:hypothetical protein
VVMHSGVPVDGPGRHGEFLAAKWIQQTHRDTSDIWINLNWLPSVDDIDQLHHHPQIGTFVFEIKGHNLGQIESYTPEATIFTNGRQMSPEGQARKAAQQFNSLVSEQPGLEKKLDCPWIHSTVWWPQISRESWCTRFSNELAKRNSLSMVFMEDMLSIEAFENRLRHILTAPLRGGVGPARANDPTKFDPVRKYLVQANSDVQPEPAKIQEIVRPLPKSQKLALDYPFGTEHRVVFTGLPGTGKTQALLEIGRLHAQAGAKVLYVCFNKTLAADKRQEILVRGREDPIPWNISAVDLFDLYRMETNPENHADLRDPVKLLRAVPVADRSQFDTILIDEAQDLKEEQFQFIYLLKAPGGSVFAAFGEGQELYTRQPAASYLDWADRAAERRLIPSYRAAAEPVIVAQATYQFLGKPLAKALQWVSDRLVSTRKAQAGAPTPLELFSTVAKDDADGRRINIVRRRIREHPVSVVCSEIGRLLVGNGVTEDTLIVVLGKDGRYKDVREALEEFDVDFIDLVQGENRRIAPRGKSVRLCTYHSARGLSARNVVVFEFENLLKVNQGKGSPNCLANIVLSRATHQTRIVVPEKSTEEHVLFLETVIAHTRKEFESING